MKTRVYLKWTLWEKNESPLLTFKIEPTRHWMSWDDKWEEDEQAENDEPDTNNIIGCNDAQGWDEIATFNDDHLNLENPDLDGWNAEEWDQQ